MFMFSIFATVLLLAILIPFLGFIAIPTALGTVIMTNIMVYSD